MLIKLGVHIVDIGFYHRNGIFIIATEHVGVRDDPDYGSVVSVNSVVCSFPDENPQQVGYREVSLARPVAYLLDLHFGQFAKTLG
ncbi:MAG: hypothetical protein DDT28_00411 [Dehalococcoidia bacterium]|nr:hypothetical protein [Chloroflexota bacterium]